MAVPACVMSDLYIEPCYNVNGNHSGLSGFLTILQAAQTGMNILATLGTVDDTKCSRSEDDKGDMQPRLDGSSISGRVIVALQRCDMTH